MPSSSSAATRPVMLTLPVVDSVVPTIIFSRVLLPAPLGPITPKISPSRTCRLTPRKASNVPRGVA